MTSNLIVQVELTSNVATLGKVVELDAQYATVIPAANALRPNQLPWTFELLRGRHVTWGQGRHDIDEFPRLSPESLQRLKAAR